MKNNKTNEILETIIKNINKKQNIDFIKKNEIKIKHIRDWIASIVENNEQWKTPRVLTIDALNNAANKYFEKQNNKIKTIELDEKHEKIIADLNNYYIVQMLTPESLDNESKQMQHCIGHGNYDDNLINSDYKYLSLRDRYNNAHATIEIYKSYIEQLQGKQNKLPNKKYLEILLDWIVTNNYEIDMLFKGYFYDENLNKYIDISKIKLEKNDIEIIIQEDTFKCCKILNQNGYLYFFNQENIDKDNLLIIDNDNNILCELQINFENKISYCYLTNKYKNLNKNIKDRISLYLNNYNLLQGEKNDYI